MPGQAYDDLLSETDVATLPWLYRFQVIAALLMLLQQVFTFDLTAWMLNFVPSLIESAQFE